MGRDITEHKYKCDDCGAEGLKIVSEDDWMRQTISWEGFESKSPDPTAVARKRTDYRASIGICKCGSTNLSNA